ncbi:MAG: hypothetical protein K6G28_00405 [Acholeplasmatales bacterium]|nr:hypothetical protein [Acholeplasmatales bacterium]
MKKIFKSLVASAAIIGGLSLTSCQKEANKEVKYDAYPFGNVVNYVVKNNGTYQSSTATYRQEQEVSGKYDKKKADKVKINRITTIQLKDKTNMYFYECGSVEAAKLVEEQKQVLHDGYEASRDANLLVFYQSKEKYDEFKATEFAGAESENKMSEDLNKLMVNVKAFTVKKGSKLSRLFNSKDIAHQEGNTDDKVVSFYEINGLGNIFEFASNADAKAFYDKYVGKEYKDVSMQKTKNGKLVWKQKEVTENGKKIKVDDTTKPDTEVVYSFKNLELKGNYVYDLTDQSYTFLSK